MMSTQCDLGQLKQNRDAEIQVSDDALVDAFSRRIQDRRDHLAQLAETYQALETTNQKLVRTEQIQGRFLTLMRDQFHDNLENLSVLLSALTLANLYDEDVQMIFDLLFNDVLSMRFHMDNVSIASHIDSGSLCAGISYFALEALLDPLENALEHLLKNGETACDWQIDESLHIYQDKDKLLIILKNALSNAIRFSPANSAVFFSMKALDEDHIEIIMRNKGEDIPDKLVIFDTFYQVDLSYGRAHHGLGLGLSVVKGLVSFMNGEVEMTREGDENQLYIILPVLKSVNDTFERFSIDKEDFVFDEGEEAWSSAVAF